MGGTEATLTSTVTGIVEGVTFVWKLGEKEITTHEEITVSETQYFSNYYVHYYILQSEGA